MVLGGQQAGPATTAKSGEIKTLGDIYARHMGLKAPEYLNSVVFLTIRTLDNVMASRIQTLLGPERVQVKLNDLEGMSVTSTANAEEVWAVSYKDKVYFRYPLGGQALATSDLQALVFNELNKNAEKAFQNDESPFNLVMKFGPGGMPGVSFGVPITVKESKESGKSVVYSLNGKVDNGEIVATILTEKDGRVTKATYDLVVDGYSMTIDLDLVGYSTNPSGKEAFVFPEAAVKGFKNGAEIASGGDGDGRF